MLISIYDFFPKYTYLKFFSVKESRIHYLIPARLQSGKFQENIPVSLAIINLFRRENKFRKKYLKKQKKKKKFYL